MVVLTFYPSERIPHSGPRGLRPRAIPTVKRAMLKFTGCRHRVTQSLDSIAIKAVCFAINSRYVRA